MGVNYSRGLTYDMFAISGEFVVSALFELTKQLNSNIGSKISKNVVIDMSATTFIDSSGINMLINLDKRTRSSHKSLFLFSPSSGVMEIIKETNLERVFQVIDSLDKLESESSNALFDAMEPYSQKETATIYKFSAECPICGSKKIHMYMLDPSKLRWGWLGDDPFPTSFDNKGEPSGYFSLLPTVCEECYYGVVNPEYLHILDSDDNIVIKSKITNEQKTVLSKNIKKRKKIFENGIVKNSDFFKYPRSKEAVVKGYELAELSAKSMLMINKKNISSFDIGYLNFMALQFAETSDKELYINNMRTWFSKSLSEKNNETDYHDAVANFALLQANIDLGRPKDAKENFNRLKKIENSLANTEKSTDGYRSPNSAAFWTAQGIKIWKNEIKRTAKETIK